MQTAGAPPRRRAGTRPKKRGRLSVLLATAAAVVVIATVALLVMWAAPLARSGAGAQDANPSGAGAAGSAIIHDDAGNVNDDYSYPIPPGKAQQLNAGSAVIHDDAGAVHPYTTPEEVDPWVNNLRGR
jgi:hypothetical protein